MEVQQVSEVVAKLQSAKEELYVVNYELEAAKAEKKGMMLEGENTVLGTESAVLRKRCEVAERERDEASAQGLRNQSLSSDLTMQMQRLMSTMAEKQGSDDTALLEGEMKVLRQELMVLKRQCAVAEKERDEALNKVARNQNQSSQPSHQVEMLTRVVAEKSPPALVPGPWTSPAVHSPVTPDQLFHRLDRNHDGVITHAEWNQAFGSQSIHPSETTSPEILQHLAGRIQSNENSDDLALQLNHLKQELSSNLQALGELTGRVDGLPVQASPPPQEPSSGVSPERFREALNSDKEQLVKENDALRRLWTELESLRRKRPTVKQDYKPHGGSWQ